MWDLPFFDEFTSCLDALQGVALHPASYHCAGWRSTTQCRCRTTPDSITMHSLIDWSTSHHTHMTTECCCTGINYTAQTRGAHHPR